MRKNSKKNYINEIIRTNYKCNWSCKFCNVLKTNAYGKEDISSKEVVYKILDLARRYNKEQLSRLTLSFSGGEPTLNKNLKSFIKLAKYIGVGVVQIQTNGSILFKNKNIIDELISAGLDEVFLAQHSCDEEINRELGSIYNISDFVDWVDYMKRNRIHEKISIYLNIVITKINVYSIYEYMKFLFDIGFMDIVPLETNNDFINKKKICFGFVQPNGYAHLNRDKVLLDFNDNQIREIHRIFELCRERNIFTDLHFTSPPLCILDYPKEYNLEYLRLKELEKNKKRGNIDRVNLESYKILWKEKQKIKECKKCKYDKYCLGFYKNWIEFVGEEYVRERIKKSFKYSHYE